jgi:Fe-S cluster assembly ATP-binding protein
MLSISNLSVKSGDFLLLEDINLEVGVGEIHAIVGDYSSGKSVLGHILAKRPDLDIISGKINFKRKSLKNLQPEDCSRLGIFLSFQDPPQVSGLSNLTFVKKMLEERNQPYQELELKYDVISKVFDLGKNWADKGLNSSADIAERKKNEIAQMLLLDPSLIVLDSLEEDLDQETVHELSQVIKEFLSRKGKSAIIISRDMDLLSRITPDFVHLVKKGKIVRSGDKRIIKRIMTNGY